MCEKRECCQRSEQRKGKPQDCSPEQIKKCHGGSKDHHCESGKKTK